MDTLYDLLGALPSDEGEELRSAFRRAVKGVHPDINPNDPDAALKFRQLVRANDILADPEQRAAYDHLLELAEVEQKQASKQVAARRIHRAASGVVALTAMSIVGVGGYALFTQTSAASLATEIRVALQARAESAPRLTAATTTAAPATGAPPTQPQAQAQAKPTLAPGALVPITVTTESIVPVPANEIGPPLDVTPVDAKSYRERGVLAYRVGDLKAAIVNLDHAVELDPKFAAAYVDRGIVFYRMKNFDRAFADLNRAKLLEKGPRAKPASPPAIKKQQTTAAPAKPKVEEATPPIENWSTAAR